MGLDNGIIIKLNDKELTKEQYKELGFNSSDICYWRKCWGIRAAIMKVLHMKDDDYEHVIELEDIPAIIKELKLFFCKEYWEEYADSIWEFNEYFETNLNNLINLKLAENFLQNNSDYKLYFYDSY